MEIGDITAVLLKQALTACQQAQPAPEELLTLDFLREMGGRSSVEKQIHLRDWLLHTIQEHLQAYRASEGQTISFAAPQTRAEILTALAADFSHKNPELQAWSALYHRYCATISISVNDLAQAAAIVPRHFSRTVQVGLDLLTDLLRREEMAAHGRFRVYQLRRYLPPPDYHQLFGSSLLLEQLFHLLRQPDGPRIISIEGLGGIGKTAVARAVANQLAENSQLESIAWISARHEWLNDRGDLQPISDPARSLADVVDRLANQLGQSDLAGLAIEEKLARLQPILAAAPRLVVIDNLETVADIAPLLPALASLKEAARFVLTSRHTLSDYPFVHRLPVPPLSLEDSRALVESELARHGRDGQLDEPSMAHLHGIVGGVPLALKLTAAQLAHLPLQDVLNSLQRANRQSSERLFTYIYHRTWQQLHETAKALLLSLLSISADGEGIDWLRLMSGLPEDDFQFALKQLTAYSLLEVAGASDAPIYRLHRLTTTFLQTEVLLNW